MKPVALVERAIRNSSKSRDVILDPFGGSGTTMVGAERLGRRARLIELDPKYVDVSVERWQALTGRTATIGETGESFAEVAAVAMVQSRLLRLPQRERSRDPASWPPAACPD